MVILDCTFRDGGYYNSWDFSAGLTSKYLEAMRKSKIDVVELGFRNFPKKEFLGAFAYSTDDYIETLDLPEEITYAVMIDAKTVLESGYAIDIAISKLFKEKKDSKISLVRIAAHYHEVTKSKDIAKKLKDLGYKVGFNLMQSAGKSNTQLSETSKEITDWNCVDILYFADSLGNMDSKEVIRIIESLKSNWQKDIGFHAHNNMDLALSNTLVAYEHGVKWLDVTVSGMGRGAGNAPTENLLCVLSKENNKYIASPIYELVIKEFTALQKSHGWGSNLLYFIGAKNNVHPMYIQKILSNKKYGSSEILGAIDYLSNNKSSSNYVNDLLEQALMPTLSNKDASSSFGLIRKYSDRDFLLIGNGPGSERYKSDIERYIRNQNPIVISININDHLPQDVVNYYSISHNSKFLSDKDRYKFINKPVILPKHRFNQSELLNFKNNHVYDYSLEIKIDDYQVSDNGCTLPSELTAAYTISAAISMGASRIYLVGFDGYDENDPRQQELIDFWILFKSKCTSIEIISLTPTTYPVPKGSIYAPKL